MDYNISILDCPICEDILNDPYECKNCHSCYCRKCIRNNCDKCKKNDFFSNQGLKKIVEQINFPCFNCNTVFKTRKELKNHKHRNEYEKNLCILCKKTFDYSQFYFHIIQQHRNHLIEIFDSKSLYNKGEQKINSLRSFNQTSFLENRSNNINSKTIRLSKCDISEIKDEDSIISVEPLRYPNYIDDKKMISGNLINIKPSPNKTDIDNNVIDSKTENIIPNNFNSQKRNNKSKESPIQLSNLHYCNQPKGICQYCSSTICKEGNCFCLGCMEYNVKNKKLKKGELINKKGRLAKKYNGIYYCNIEFIKETQTYNGPISLNMNCSSLTNCKDCIELNAICKQYEDFIRYD